MDLSDRINAQYKRRSSKTHLYQVSAYTEAVQKELKKATKALLQTVFKDISALTVLEIGAGNGTNAYMFEELGVKRENISFNELLQERVENIRLNFPHNKLYTGDAIHTDFQEKYDVVFQSTVFTSVLNESDRKKLADKMWSLLNPGGVILWYDFVYNNPRNKDVRKVTVAQTLALFHQASHHVLKKITLAPPIGRKVGKLYGFFNLPFLRTHVLAIFQKGSGSER